MMMLYVTSCSKDSNVFVENQKNIPFELREVHDLCFMTWNAALGLGTDGALSDEESALEICNQVLAQDPSVLTIQEAWDGDSAEILKECLEANGYCVSYNPGPHANNIFGSGALSALNADGLMTAVKKELGACDEMEQNSTFVEFECENGIINDDNDALADKGFLITEITMENGCTMNVINTHLDAGGSDDDQCARVCQIIQLNEYMLENNCGVSLLGGDFNINALSEAEIAEKCIEEFDLPEGQTEFDILKFLFDGDPTMIHSQSPPLNPTSLGGGGLIDFHMISNFDKSFIDITSVTNVDMVCTETFEVRYRGGFLNLKLKTATFATLAEAEDFVKNEENDGIIIGPIRVCHRAEDISDHTPVETCLEYDCDAAPDEEITECFCEIDIFFIQHSFQIDCEDECPFWAERVEEIKDCF